MNGDSKENFCICEAASRFRPSDWAQRLAGFDALFGADQRLRFSRYLQPVKRAGRQCLRISAATRSERPELWQSVFAFAEENGLAIEAAAA